MLKFELSLYIWLSPLFCGYYLSNKYGAQLNMCCVGAAVISNKQLC